MSKRLTLDGQPVGDEIPEDTSEDQEAGYIQTDTAYKNPFTDPDYPKDEKNWPYVFTDVDWELWKNPRLFNGMEEIEKQIEGMKESNSKSQVNRIWQYTRWKTWKYLNSIPKQQIVINPEENEKALVRGTASVNGVIYYIIKGIYVYVPSDIAEIIRTSQGQTLAAGQNDLVMNLSKKLDPQTGLPKDPTRIQ